MRRLAAPSERALRAAGWVVAAAVVLSCSESTAPDVTPPAVSGTSPAAGAIGVPTAALVTVTFSEAMNPSTINGSTFSLVVTSGGAGVGGTVSYDSNTHVATYTPSAPLANTTGYTATVTTGARDVAGNGLASNATFSFTTVQSVTGFWSGTTDNGSLHFHLTIDQSGLSLSLRPNCTPGDCRSIPLTASGFTALQSNIPVDITSASGSFNDPSISITLTAANGTVFNYTATVSGSNKMVGTMSGPTLSPVGLTVVKQGS
jgi:Bacterial Ig-like domain